MTLYQRHYATTPTSAGGEATLGEILEASELAGRSVDNSNASNAALEEAFSRRIDDIENATGVRLEHPRARAMRNDSASLLRNPFSRLAEMDTIPEHLASFQDDLEKLAAKHPDAADVFALDKSFEDQARELAADAEQDLNQLSASRDGLGKYGAMFAGGAAAALQDPVQTPLMVLGAGPGAARSVAGRIGSVAIKEALIGGASEIALQPSVQAWRKEVGLPHGFDNAAEQVLFSTAFGGVLGGGARAGAEVFAGLGKYLKGSDTQIANAANGDVGAIRATLGPVRDDLPAEVRGALDALEVDGPVSKARQKGVDPEIHDELTARAIDDLQADTPSNQLQLALEARRRPATGNQTDIVAEGPHGPVLDRFQYEGRWKDAVTRLRDLQSGEIPAAVFHPDVGDIDVIWGNYNPGTQKGSGLAKIVGKHPEVVDDLPLIIPDLEVTKRTDNRVQLESADHKASVRLDYDSAEKAWLLTAFEKGRRPGGSTERSSGKVAATSATPPADENIGLDTGNVEPAGRSAEAEAVDGPRRGIPPLLADLDRMPEITNKTPTDLANEQSERMLRDVDLDEAFPLIQMLDEDGRLVAGSVTLGDALDEADRGLALADVIDACKVNR